MSEVQYRLMITEMDRWSGPSKWHKDYAVESEAILEFRRINNSRTLPYTPDEYDIAESVHEIVTVDGKVFVGRKVFPR